MKKIKLFAAIIIPLSLLLFACNGNKNNTNVGKELTADNTPATISSSSSGDARFSYSLDGAEISGGPTEDIAASFNNQAQVTQNDYGKSVAFFLNDASNDDAVTYPHSIRFVVKAAMGTQQVSADEDHWSVQLFISSGGSYTIYGGEAFTVTITSISASRVSGTFSGKFKLATPGAGKGELTVTDGKFDIPLGADKG